MTTVLHQPTRSTAWGPQHRHLAGRDTEPGGQRAGHRHTYASSAGVLFAAGGLGCVVAALMQAHH